MFRKFLKALFCIILILIIYCITDGKGKSIHEFEAKNKTKFDPSEVSSEILNQSVAEESAAETFKAAVRCDLYYCLEPEGTCEINEGIFPCNCPPGITYYVDAACQAPTKVCNELPKRAKEEGDCLVKENLVQCSCPDGNYTRKYDECSVVKCENKGECIIQNGKEICNCTNGYTGEFCEIDSVKEECNARRLKCEETGGYCWKWGDRGNWQDSEDEDFICHCPDSNTLYEQNIGCKTTRKRCDDMKPNCEETGGFCLSDKNEIIYCKCPNYTTYDRDTGCQIFEHYCQELIKYCSETGGYCVTVNNTIAECRCPKYAEYKNGIGCQGSEEFCNIHKSNCVETGGVCVFQKYNSLQCRCPNNTVYDTNAGCQSPCGNEPCQNGGKCVITEKSFKCICKHPFRGKFCEVGRKDNFDDCYTNICKNGGICRTLNGEAKCFCMEPYGGKLCDSRTDFSRNTIIYTVLLALLSLVVISGICTMCYRNCSARRN